MNGRERLNAVLHKQPTDRLSWTTLVDNVTLSQVLTFRVPPTTDSTVKGH